VASDMTDETLFTLNLVVALVGLALTYVYGV
jgi:hypothetical protein